MVVAFMQPNPEAIFVCSGAVVHRRNDAVHQRQEAWACRLAQQKEDDQTVRHSIGSLGKLPLVATFQSATFDLQKLGQLRVDGQCPFPSKVRCEQ